MAYGLAGLLAIAVVAVAAAWYVTSDDGDDAADASNEVEQYLFVVTAERGTLDPVTGQDGTYTLTLEGVHPSALYFSDRPFRDAGSLTIEGVLEEVYGPDETAPNAALVFHAEGEEGSTIALELTEPDYDAASGALTYVVRPLGQTGTSLAWLEYSDFDPAGTSFEEAELFIDSGYFRCYQYLENNTPYTLQLQVDSMDPPYSSNKWGTHPPLEIKTGVEARYVFRYHSKSEDQTARFHYSAVPLVATDPGPFDVELRMDCGTNTGGSQGGVGSRNNCIVEDAAAPFSCKRTDITDRSFHFELEPK